MTQTAQHTPGPWNYGETTDGRAQVSANGVTLCQSTPSETKIRGLEHALANARLIAAAPQMLKALQFILIDANSTLDYEARLILEAAVSCAAGKAEAA